MSPGNAAAPGLATEGGAERDDASNVGTDGNAPAHLVAIRNGHVDVQTCIVAPAVYYPPVGRRRLGAVVVRTCPACSHMHLHRAEFASTADGTLRTGSCGAQYVLRVLHHAEAGA